jgi:hypothetical protein
MSHPVLGTPHSTDIDGIIGGGGTGNSKLSYVISFWSVPQISDSFPNKQTNKHVQWIVGAAVPAGTLFNALYKLLKYLILFLFKLFSDRRWIENFSQISTKKYKI